MITLSSDRLDGILMSFTPGKSGSRVPSFDRGEYATTWNITGLLRHYFAVHQSSLFVKVMWPIICLVWQFPSFNTFTFSLYLILFSPILSLSLSLSFGIDTFLIYICKQSGSYVHYWQNWLHVGLKQDLYQLTCLVVSFFPPVELEEKDTFSK